MADIKVFVSMCSRCGLEAFSLSKPARAACPRCHNDFRPVRVIARPHYQTVAQAEREDALAASR